MPTKINHAVFATMFGPTTSARVRLADIDLIVEAERELTAELAGGDAVAYGEEGKFGGGKVTRDGMGQSQVTRTAGPVDTVITNALCVHGTNLKTVLCKVDG